MPSGRKCNDRDFFRNKAIYRFQQGFTVLELLCSMATLGLLATVLSISVMQIKVTTPGVNAKSAAVQDIGNAGYHFFQDVMMAQTSDLPDNGESVNSVTMTWMDRFNDVDTVHTISYSVTGGNLLRNYDGEVTVVSRHVNTAVFWMNGNTLFMAVAGLVSGQPDSKSVQHIYQARMRAVA